MESALIAQRVWPMLQRLEKWGRTCAFEPGEARRLLADLFEAAGPGRQEHVPELFEMCVRKCGVVDREKIDWLRKQLELIRRNPVYWPRERPEFRDDTSRNAMLKVIRQAPGQTADIATMMKRMGRTRDGIVNLTRRLIDEHLIVRIGPGQFTLPGNTGAKQPASSAVRAILDWFRSQPPGTCAKATQIAAALGRNRQAIDSALNGYGQMVKKGLVIAVKRGVFKLGE